MATAPLLHLGAMVTCPHGGQATPVPSSARVLVGGQPVTVAADPYTIAGCPFQVPGAKPQPCVTVQWIVPAIRVRVGGQPVLLQTSTGLCKSAEQIPQGAPIVSATQPRVLGT